MADTTNYIPSVSVKGLNTDFKIDSLTEGEYPYALNAVSRDNLQFLTNDLSNELCVELDGNILGEMYINYDTYILFLDNNSIIKLNVNTCSFTVLLQLDCLNFSINNQIRAAFTVLNDCNQLIIYWTDDDNNIRYYNVDTNEGIDDCAKLSLNPCNIVPTFTQISVLNNGGTIKTGTYQFVTSFGKINDNNTPLYTNWSHISNPLSIHEDDLSGPFWAIDGAFAGTDTTKSIYLRINGLPENYNIIRIAVIIIINQIVNVKLITSSNYAGNEFEFYYSGDSEQDVNIELAEVTTNKASYLRAKDLIIKDNRLIIANLKTIKNINYQKHANNITLDYYTTKVRIDVEPFAYKSPDYILSHKSWMRDEVYNIAVVWEFCDGSYSRAFHILGREKQCFDYRLDEGGVPVTTDLEGYPLCDEYILPDDANIIDCDLEKWKNRNTSIRTQLEGCAGQIILNVPLISAANSILCSGCVVYGESVSCNDPSCVGDIINCSNTSCHSTGWGPQGSCPDGQVEAFSVYSPNYHIYTLVGVDLTIYGWTLIQTTLEYLLWEGCWDEDSELDLSTLPGSEVGDNCIPIPELTCIYSRGKLGYHESCERYPLITDCDGEYMYPTELDENDNIRGQYIRYHRMPDSASEPHYTTTNNAYVEPKELVTLSNTATPYNETYIYPLGISVSNIVPPDDVPLEMIKGFRIVYVKRTNSNKSVIAKGNLHGTFRDADENNALYLIPKHGINSYEYWAYPGGGGQHPETLNSTGDNIEIIGGYTFISPNTSFLKPELIGDYIKIEWEYYGRGDVYGDRDEWDNDDFCDGYNWGRRQNININQKQHSIIDGKWQINRTLKGLLYAPADTFVENSSNVTFPLDNRNRESSVYLELKNTDFDDRLRLIHFKNEYQGDDPSAGPNAIDEIPIKDSDDSFTKISFEEGLPSPIDNPVRERLNTMGSSATQYVSIKRNDCSQYGRVENSIYISTGLRMSVTNVSADSVFNIEGIYGDSFINYWTYRRTSRIGKAGEGDDNDGGAEWKFEPRTLKTLVHSIVESDVNVDLRHEGGLLKESYYPKLKNKTFNLDSAVPNSAKPLNSYLNGFYYNDCVEEVQDFTDNYYAYNYDYSNVNDKMLYLPVNATYKTCDCIGELPNTIAYSNKTNLNNFNLNDFLAENYLTVPSNYGPINNLFVLNNSLYAHTRDIIWKIFSNEKQLKLDENTVYIGQGDLFGKDPLSVYASDVGYAGNILQFGTLSTENGYYFYDIYGGKIHHFTDKLDDLGLKKMSNFFKDNSKFCLPLSNLDNYNNPNGIGVKFIYDYYNNRLLLSKKDYDINPPYVYGGIYNEDTALPNTIYQHPLLGNFLITLEDPLEYSFISLHDNTYFCDKSFTLSYSYNLDAWVSFHSFVPDYYLFNRNNFYSVLDKKVYRHNVKCNYHNYYGISYPYILDLVVISKPNVVSDTYTTLHWNSFAYECDANTNQTFKNEVSFNKLLLYNSRQSTGLLNLNFSKGGYLRTEPIYPNVNFDRNERHFSMTNIRDYVENYDLPMFISECETQCGHDIKKIFNDLIINPNKHYMQLQRMRDTYMVARFILDNTNNIKLVMDYLITTAKTSIR